MGRRRGQHFSAQNHGDTLLIRMRLTRVILFKKRSLPEINFKLTLKLKTESTYFKRIRQILYKVISKAGKYGQTILIVQSGCSEEHFSLKEKKYLILSA